MFFVFLLFPTADLECTSCQSCAHKLEDSVHEAIFDTEVGTGAVNAKGDGRVEASHGYAATGVCACNDHETDGKAIELVLASMHFGGSNIQHDKAEHEGIKQFRNSCLPPAVTLGWLQVEGLAEYCKVAKACNDTCRDL